MKHFLFLLAVAGGLNLLGSCVRLQYDVDLTGVKLSDGTDGALKNNAGKVFEDGKILIEWQFNNYGLGFSLFNKTDRAIKIIWEDSVFVDIKGVSNRVIHKGVRLLQKDKAMPPSIVAPQSKVVEFISPFDLYYFSKKGWGRKPLFRAASGSSNRAKRIKAQYVGRVMKVFLALLIKEKPENYIFSFVVK